MAVLKELVQKRLAELKQTHLEQQRKAQLLEQEKERLIEERQALYRSWLALLEIEPIFQGVQQQQLHFEAAGMRFCSQQHIENYGEKWLWMNGACAGVYYLGPSEDLILNPPAHERLDDLSSALDSAEVLCNFIVEVLAYNELESV